MSKFKVIKRLSLAFLGEDWKDCYISYNAITVSDVKNKFPKLASIDPDDVKAVNAGIDNMLDILKEKFIEGKSPEGDLTKEDLDEMPVEIIRESLSFLSAAKTNISPL